MSEDYKYRALGGYASIQTLDISLKDFKSILGKKPEAEIQKFNYENPTPSKFGKVDKTDLFLPKQRGFLLARISNLNNLGYQLRKVTDRRSTRSYALEDLGELPEFCISDRRKCGDESYCHSYVLVTANPNREYLESLKGDHIGTLV